jgi:hypothetical protein
VRGLVLVQGLLLVLLVLVLHWLERLQVVNKP